MLKIPLFEIDNLAKSIAKKRLSRIDETNLDSVANSPKNFPSSPKNFPSSPKVGGSPRHRRTDSFRNLFAMNSPEPQVEKVLTYQEKLDKILASHHRTRDDAKFLYEDLKDTPFCMKYLDTSDFDDQAIVDIFKNMKLEKYPQGTVLIKEGEESNNKAYIIMKGSVGIYRKKQDFYALQNQQAEEEDEKQGKSSQGRTTPPKELKDIGKQSSFKTEKTELKSSLASLMSESIADLKKLRMSQVDSSLMITERSEKSNFNDTRRNSIMINVEPRISNIGSRRESIFEVQVKREDSTDSSGKKSSFFGELLVNSLMNNKGKSFFKPKETAMDLPTKESDDLPPLRLDLGLKHSHSLNMESMIGAPVPAPVIKKDKKKSAKDLLLHEDPYTYLGHHVMDITEKGEIFGEYALQYDSNRTASIVAKKDVILLSITKESYANMRRKKALEESDQISFIFGLIPFLDQVHNEESKREIMRSFNLNTYPRKSTPMIEGELGEDLFIIYDGILLVTKTVMIEVEPDYVEKGDKYYQYFNQKKTKKEEINLGYFGKGTIFGEEILLAKKGQTVNYRYTLQVFSETAKIFKVSRAHLRIKIPLETTKEMRANYGEKKKAFDEELQVEIEKRKFFIISPSLDVQPLMVKRHPLRLILPKNEKINGKINKVDTLKVLSTKANPKFLPKVMGAPMESNDTDPKMKEFHKNFSRFNYMPKSIDRPPDDLKNIDAASARNILRPSLGGIHITSNEKSPRNLDHYMSSMDKKLDMKFLSRSNSKSVHDINNFKFSFNEEEAPLTERLKKLQSLISPRNPKLTPIQNSHSTNAATSITSHKHAQSLVPSPFFYQAVSARRDSNFDLPKESKHQSPKESTFQSPFESHMFNLESPSMISYTSDAHQNANTIVLTTEFPYTQPSPEKRKKKKHASLSLNEKKGLNSSSLNKISTGTNKYSDKTKLKSLIEKAKDQIWDYKVNLLKKRENSPPKNTAFLYKCIL